MVGAGRTRSQRGLMALLSALFASVMLIFFVVLIELCFFVETRVRLASLADAFVTAIAAKATISPLPSNVTNVNFSAIALGNGLSQASRSTIIGPVGWRSMGTAADDRDAYYPLFYSVSVSSPVIPSGITSLVPSVLLSQMPGSLTQVSSARLHQVNLGTFNYIPDHVMMLLDVSASMRLPYDPRNPQISALAVERDVAKQIIGLYGSRTVDLGLLMFADGVASSEKFIPLLGTKANSGQRQTQVQSLTQSVSTFPGAPSNTDFADAINAAADAVNAQQQKDGLFSSGRFILISDGEPDAGPGISTSEPLAARTAAADAAATTAMQKAWAKGIVSDVIYMQHLQASGNVTGADADNAEAFMSGIAGSNVSGHAKSNTSNYLQDGGVAASVYNFVSDMPLTPYCQFSYLLPQLMPRYFTPRIGSEPLYAYFAPNYPLDASEVQIPRANIFINDSQGFKDWTINQHAKIDGNGNVSPPNALSNPQNLALYYDGNTGQVYVSSWLCVALNSPNNQQRQMRIRLRWGAPHLVPSDNATAYLN